MSTPQEINLDGLPGPTHNFSGLSYGNEASMENDQEVSNPQKAALQSLAKMKFMMSLGLTQAIMPPHERPFIPLLKQIGFSGRLDLILDEAKRKAPWIFRYLASSSAMWTANAATVTPSIDSGTKHLHFTPANLIAKLHRSIEPETTGKILKAIFANPTFFTHHAPLPLQSHFSDEGAANHIRFGKTYGPGVHLFVYGFDPESEYEVRPRKYPARHSRKASEAIAAKHEIFDKQILYVQQNPEAIDRGVFHNDVISTGNLNLFMWHEEAFVKGDQFIEQLRGKMADFCDTKLLSIKVPSNRVSLFESVKTYLFNSQLISLPDGSMTMLAPSECLQSKPVQSFLSELEENSEIPINQIHYLDLKQSMKNGGGPACLRLRILMNEVELDAMNKNVIMTEDLYNKLVHWVKKHYRDRLTPHDLFDIALWNEGKNALNELTKILNLGSIYSFQE